MSVDTSVNTVTERPVVQENRRAANSSPGKLRFALRNGLFLLSLLILIFIMLCAVFPGWIATHSPTLMNTSAILQAPGWPHLLGTDQFGRDIFSLLVYGSRQSLWIGIGSVIIGGLAGSFIGLLAGYWGRITDSLLMRCMEIIMTIPGILFAIVISSALGPSLVNTITAVGLSTLPGYARVMRSQVMKIRSLPFIDAARATGTSHAGIIVRHLIPNCLPPLIVMATIGVGSAILIGTALSFLGLGVISEIPDWGYLLSQGRDYLAVAWWIGFFPGAAISLLVIAINLLGDELRNRMDPKKTHAG